MHTFAYFSFVEDGSEAVKDAIVRFRRFLGKESTNLAHKTNCDLDTIVGGLFKKKNENFEGENFVHDPLVDEMGEKHGSRVADCLIVTLEGASELRYQTNSEQLSDHGKFGVDNSCERSKDGGE